jgi:hypothetical protein
VFCRRVIQYINRSEQISDVNRNILIYIIKDKQEELEEWKKKKKLFGARGGRGVHKTARACYSII